ncbi:hypothetical protein [Pseudomonas sp.]|uniref:hypothetical protein n=1 Tax=Pseudomonas sp. TaxID=306 RepID=UPI003FD823A7
MNPALTINPDNGFIHIVTSDSVLVIDSGLRQHHAAVLLAQFYQSELDHHNGYLWQVYQGASIDGHPAGFSLCFHSGELIQIHFGLSAPAIDTENDWPTKESIEQEIDFLNDAFSRQLSRSFEHGEAQFSWGTAWARFDAKGFSASSGIRYAG